MARNYIKERWVELDGSIATERIYDSKSDWGIELKDRKWIAFNIGKELATHIVNLHNSSLHEITAKVTVA